jgi:hypothetical protein
VDQYNEDPLGSGQWKSQGRTFPLEELCYYKATCVGKVHAPNRKRLGCGREPHVTLTSREEAGGPHPGKRHAPQRSTNPREHDRVLLARDGNHTMSLEMRQGRT